GTLNKLDGRTTEVEVDRKAVAVKTPQVSAIVLGADPTERPRPGGTVARVVLTTTSTSAGGRFTLSTADCDGKTFQGKTASGAQLRVGVERIAALEVLGGKAVYLSDLQPAKYEYLPYLDERWPWSADATATGRDLRVGGSVYDKGVGMHAHARLTYALGGAYRRFEAQVGLDDLDGRRGAVRLAVLADGKALDLGKAGELTHKGGAWAVRLKVEGV